MIYITQLIYIKEGKENTFQEFENVAIPILKNYGGELLLRIRPSENEIIEQSIETPYEIHFLSFLSENHLSEFMKDEERKKFTDLKEASIRSVLLVKGEKMG